VTRRRLLIAGIVVVLVAVAGIAAVLLAGGDEDKPKSAAGLADCAKLGEDEIRGCYAAELNRIVETSDDPTQAVAEITELSRKDLTGFLLPNCHGLMHTVGREYARDHNLTLAALKDVLPKSNDPGCPAGFAHGLVTGVAPLIDPRDPKAAAAVCDETDTRYERYSCTHGFGHAFMRISNEDLTAALALCTKLGPNAGPDCAQGAFHDYWFSVAGFDDAKAPPNVETDPQTLCGAQDPEYVRQCWYRAFVDNRPPGTIERSTDVARLCQGLTGLQAEGCITAGTVIGPADPRSQFPLCFGFTGRQALACVRGIKLQNLLGASSEVYADVLTRCDGFPEAVRLGCYRWLGKTAAVLTDGAFETTGCPLLPEGPSRKACIAGAGSMEGPLVTFS
jgi:hypothetical protein